MFKYHPFFALAVACVGCGASFSANADGGGGSAGPAQAGEASGGLTSSAGSPSTSDAGAMDLGGTSSAGQPATAGTGTGGTGTAGTGTGGAGAGRNWGNGGQGSGGWWSGNGGNTGAECGRLRSEYTNAVDKARVCDKGSSDECSITSVEQPIGCGCPVLVNAKSEYTVTANNAYQAYLAANCGPDPVLCDNYCVPPVSASCAEQSSAMGSSFVCAGVGAGTR